MLASESSLTSAPPVPLAYIRQIRTFQLVFSVVAIAALIAGVGFLVYAQFSDEKLSNNLTSLGICAVSTAVSMTASFFLERSVFKRIQAQERLPEAASLHVVRWFELEDYDTRKRWKILPDDMGVMWVDESQRVVHLEGLHLRYTIHFRDISACHIVKSNDLNRAELKAVLPSGLLHVVLKSKKVRGSEQRKGKMPPLFNQISNIL